MKSREVESARKITMYGCSGGVWYVALIVVTVFLYNEYLTYYITIYMTCSWPALSSRRDEQKGETRVMMLTDIHLLGPRRGHWFDKLRRFAFLFFIFTLSAKIKVNEASHKRKIIMWHFRVILYPKNQMWQITVLIKNFIS